jgi:hypothetical protein
MSNESHVQRLPEIFPNLTGFIHVVIPASFRLGKRLLASAIYG